MDRISHRARRGDCGCGIRMRRGLWAYGDFEFPRRPEVLARSHWRGFPLLSWRADLSKPARGTGCDRPRRWIVRRVRFNPLSDPYEPDDYFVFCRRICGIWPRRVAGLPRCQLFGIGCIRRFSALVAHSQRRRRLAALTGKGGLDAGSEPLFRRSNSLLRALCAWQRAPQAMMSCTTCPCTSVRRKSRPA